MKPFFRYVCVVLSLLGYCSHSAAQTTPADVDLSCPDANIFANVIDQICWDCFLNDFTLFGVGSPPDGASSDLNLPVCGCLDALGVPEFGWPLGYWSPQKLNEVVATPWCSPSLNLKLQDTWRGLGHNKGENVGMGDVPRAFYHYHYFAYPIMAMVGALTIPSCSGLHTDFDLLYVSELDPTWNNSLLHLLLNPEAIIFSTPLTKAWCAADCILTTADNQLEEFYGCAGCDGSLYPITGNVFPQQDPVAGSSLVTQRVLAGLHRKGLAQKTIGDEAMCPDEITYFPTVPRSQYKFSMLWPVPEASNSLSKGIVAPFIGDPTDTEDQKLNDDSNNAGQSGVEAELYEECCHPMGMSTARWCTPVGGRTRPGKDNAFIYMIWNYRNCCVLPMT